MTLFHQPLFNARFLTQRAGSEPTPPEHKKLLADRNAWEDWFVRQKADVDALSAHLAALEAELNRAVYALFKLDAQDIALLEGGAGSVPT